MVKGDVKKLLFVYGTLRRGFYNHSLLYGAMGGEEDIVDGFYMRDLGYFPMIFVEGDGGSAGYGGVVVEIYEIDDEIFKRCDELEGYESGFYDRCIVKSRKGVEGWIYFGRNERYYRDCPVIQSGDWSKKI